MKALTRTLAREGPERGPETALGRPAVPVVPTVILLGLVLLAAALRLWQLQALPNGLWTDEAFNGVDARMLLKGIDLPAYFVANNGREPLFIYLQALTVAIVGPMPYALYLVSAVLGILTVPAVYFLARTLETSDASQPGAVAGRSSAGASWPALLAAAGLAVSYWHVSLSRLGLRAVMLPLVSALAIAFFWRAWTRGSWRDFALAGFWLGVAQYTYSAARVLPLVPFLFILSEAIGDLRRVIRSGRQEREATWTRWRTRLARLCLLCAVAALVLVPLAVTAWQNPVLFFRRADQVSIFAAPAQLMPGAPWQRFSSNVVSIARSFYDRGDVNLRHNLPGRPVNDPLLAGLFTLGWLTALWKIRRPQYRLVLIWLPVMLTPTLFSIEAPHSLRGSGALPPLAVLYGLGGGALLGWLRRPALRKHAASALLLLVVLIGGGLTARDYFIRWPAAPRQGEVFTLRQQMAANTIVQMLADSPEGRPIVVPYHLFTQPHTVFALGVVPQYASTAPPPAVSDSHDIRFIFEGPFDLQQPMFLVWRQGGETQSVVLERLSPADADTVYQQLGHDPAVDTLTAPGYQQGQARLFVGRFPAGVRLQPVAIETPLNVRFESGVRLVGYSVKPDQVSPGQQPDVFQLTLFWQLDRPLESTDKLALQAFAHLTSDGNVWGVRDTTLVERDLQGWLSPGHVVQDSRLIQVPGQMRAGKAIFEVGQYRKLPGAASENPERVDILDADGRPVADHLMLGAVTIGDAPPRADLGGLAAVGARFSDGIELVDWKASADPQAQGALKVELGWRATARMTVDYTVFVHLLDPQGQIVGQQDGPPGGPTNPTTYWVPGETVRSAFQVQLPPGLDTANSRLRIGLYDRASGRQLPLAAVADSAAWARGETYLTLPVPK